MYFRFKFFWKIIYSQKSTKKRREQVVKIAKSKKEILEPPHEYLHTSSFISNIMLNRNFEFDFKLMVLRSFVLT